MPQGRGMPVLKLSQDLTHPGIDKSLGVLVSLVRALARARLLLRDRRIEVLGIPLMRLLLIGMPLERRLHRLRPVITIRGPDGTCLQR